MAEPLDRTLATTGMIGNQSDAMERCSQALRKASEKQNGEYDPVLAIKRGIASKRRIRRMYTKITDIFPGN